MKATFLSVILVAAPVYAGFEEWHPPGPYDGKIPSPYPSHLPPLARCSTRWQNHNFLPHTGKDITKEATENALFDALNINKTLGGFLFDFAIRTSPLPNATTFSLNDLGTHNILEHDASLSRSDAHFGNPLTFNQSVFDETKSHWTDEMINIEMGAKARYARIQTSSATNPSFELSELGSSFSFGESVAYVIVTGDKVSGTANRSWVEWLFEHEQLPLHLGWQKPATLFQESDLFGYMEQIRNITKALEGETPAVRRSVRKSLGHFGW
ncbi:Chloroperoxidase [Podospora aff. communis PSN243]|uniref:Chloroperoxidase n=1 Tax=Podospora aff. communis PSN243 TaxID=3040156 RepID=A0AAV9GB85_9PEZI|nr:Chloroperoxidase [Podospora aff. communis PSN243]